MWGMTVAVGPARRPSSTKGRATVLLSGGHGPLRPRSRAFSRLGLSQACRALAAAPRRRAATSQPDRHRIAKPLSCRFVHMETDRLEAIPLFSGLPTEELEAVAAVAGELEPRPTRWPREGTRARALRRRKRHRRRDRGRREDRSGGARRGRGRDRRACFRLPDGQRGRNLADAAHQPLQARRLGARAHRPEGGGAASER